MCDYREYATALSAEDVLDLYHTPASIDNLGSVHAFEFEEMDTLSLYDFSAPWTYESLTGAIENIAGLGDCIRLTTSAANQRAYKAVTNV